MHDFARKQRSYDAIPPTWAALVQHIRRAIYQAAVYGVGLWCASLKRRVLLNGDGNKKETAGAHYGLHSHQLPVQDAVSRTVQVLQVRFEMHGHVQLHLLKIVFTRTMTSYMTSYVHMHTHVCTRLCFTYYLLFSIVRNGVNIMKIT